MSARRSGLRVGASFYLHVGSDCRTRVFAMPERDRVAAGLDGVDGDVSLIVDRDGITLLESLLSAARAELDTAQDEMAAAIDAELSAERMSA